MALVIPKMVGVQGQRAHCSAPVKWGLLVGPGIKAALYKSSGHVPRELAQPLTAPLGPEVASQTCPGPAEVCGWGVLGKSLFWAFLSPPSCPPFPLAPEAALWLLSTPGRLGGQSGPIPCIHPAPRTLPGSSQPLPLSHQPTHAPYTRERRPFLFLLLLTCSLCSGAHVCHSARAQRRPRVTAHTPWGFSPPELKATRRPQRGRT